MGWTGKKCPKCYGTGIFMVSVLDIRKCMGCEGTGYEFINDELTDEGTRLPKIYVFSTSFDGGEGVCYALAEDGTILGAQWCVNQEHAKIDLGVQKGCRPDRHEDSYKVKYPNGYEMEYIPVHNKSSHEGLRKALMNRSELKEKGISTVRKVIKWEVNGVLYDRESEARAAESMNSLAILIERNNLDPSNIGPVAVARKLLACGWALPNLLSTLLRMQGTPSPETQNREVS